MMGDDKKDDVEPITDADLGDLVGGGRSYPATVTGKFTSNDTIVGVSNDTLFSGGGRDITGFTAPGDVPGFKKKR
ncbi:MAG: hypothetical protein AAF409_12380 [Pseudomonadota bacterium]